MRISDWSSDVCSSDLSGSGGQSGGIEAAGINRFRDAHPFIDGKAGVARQCRQHVIARLLDTLAIFNLPKFPHCQRSVVGAPKLFRGRVIIVDKQEGVYQAARSEEHTSKLQSLMRISYAVFCLKKKKKKN